MNSVWKEAFCMYLFFYVNSPALHSQTNNPKYQFGVGAGIFVYQGDLTPSSSGSYKTIRPVINLFASKFYSSSFSARGNIAMGTLKGDDARYEKPEYRQQRNFNFHTPLVEIMGIGEWNLFGRNYISKGFAPYVFAGVGYSFLRITRDWSRLNTSYFSSESSLMAGLAADAQRTPPRGLLIFPAGAGIRYYLSDNLGLSLEGMYRGFSNDYLDGFSEAANPGKGDHYYSYTIGLVYRTGKKNMLDCPVIRY